LTGKRPKFWAQQRVSKSVRICPILEEAAGRKPFVVPFLNFVTTSKLMKPTMLSVIFGQVAPGIVRQLDPKSWPKKAYLDNADSSVSICDARTCKTERQLVPIDRRELSAFFDRCIASGLRAEAKAIVKKVADESMSFDRRTLELVTITFLREAILVNNKNDIPLGDILHPSTYKAVLTHYVNTFVGPEPEKPPNGLVRSAARCPFRDGPCQNCQQLTQFLQDPLASTGHWQLFISRHDHIREALTNGGSDCKAQTLHENGEYVIALTKMTWKYDGAFKSWDDSRNTPRLSLRPSSAHIAHAVG
jgi:hypothetical protein